MSEDNAQPSRLVGPLPSELAQVESMLAAMSLPGSSLRRDQMLFQAGWVAAEARSTTTSSNRVADDRRSFPSQFGRSTLVASAVISAVVAASLAVVVTMSLFPSAPAPGHMAADQDSSSGTAAERGQDAAVQLNQMDTSPAAPVSRRTATLLIMRDRALKQQWDDLLGTGENRGVSESLPNEERPKTSRELLDELIPPSQRRDMSAI